MFDINKDTQSVTDFRRNSSQLIQRLQVTQSPLALTVKGKVAAVVQDADSYHRLLDIAARADLNEAIRQGLDDVERGRTRPASEVFNEIRRRYGIPGWGVRTRCWATAIAGWA